MEGEWFTIATVGTFSGAVFAVTLIVQFLKSGIDQVVKMPTRLLTLVIAWILLLGHRYITTGEVAFDGLYLDGLNGFLVALAAIGTHSVAKDKLNWR